MTRLGALALVLILAACQTTPPTLDPDPDPEPEPLAVSFRTYYATGGGAQLLVFEDIAANRPAAVTVYAACSIDEGDPVPRFVEYEGGMTLETLGSDRAIPRKYAGVDMGPGTIHCWSITASSGGEAVPITER